jgi:glutamate/tyrosine decarboxylase-like PLP-dependent enzyme
VFAFTLRTTSTTTRVFDVSNAMRERGWQVPAYTFPRTAKISRALRVVVRRGFTHDCRSARRGPEAAAAAPAQPALYDEACGTAFAH